MDKWLSERPLLSLHRAEVDALRSRARFWRGLRFARDVVWYALAAIVLAVGAVAIALAFGNH